jgi:signal transduction histidine kinase
MVLVANKTVSTAPHRGGDLAERTMTNPWGTPPMTAAMDVSPAIVVDDAKRLLRAALATADGWWEWDLATGHAWFSNDFFRLLGFPGQQPLTDAASWHARIHPADLSRVRNEVDTHALGGPPFDLQFRMRTASGEFRWFRTRGRCTCTGEGKARVLSGNLQDIHSHKLLALQGNTQAQLLVERQRMDSIHTMAGGVAHEFNNLLQVMQGYVQCASRSLQPGCDAASDLQQAQGAIDRAIKLNREFLAFCRTGEVEEATVDLNITLDALAERLYPILPPDISLSTHASDSPLLVKVHEAGLHEALLNLATNARDAMPRGGQLTARCYALEVDARNATLFPELTTGLFACLSITDTGEGIDPELVHRVWEPFFTTKAANAGSGLGLAQVYGFAHRHKGAVGLYSRRQRGTTFRIYLPLSNDRGTARADKSDTEWPVEHPIVLLSSDGLLADTLRNFVAPRGSIVHVDSPELLPSALEQYAGNCEWALLDWDDPHRLGAEVHCCWPEVKVACFTGFDLEASLGSEPRDRHDEWKPDALVEKPLDARGLFRSLSISGMAVSTATA